MQQTKTNKKKYLKIDEAANSSRKIYALGLKNSPDSKLL